MMDAKTRKRLDAAGFKIGTAAEFLGLSDDERQMVELRLRARRLVRHERERQGLTQQQLARRIQSSQSCVADLEAGEACVPLESIFKAIFALGANLSDLLDAPARPRQEQAATPKKPKRAGSQRTSTTGRRRTGR